MSVCGVRLNGATHKALTVFRREKIGFIFQFHNLMPSLTALENVLLALEAARKKITSRDNEQAMQYLEAVGLGQKSRKFPGQLSGGEQQRVAIARALVKQPPLILADEPTGNLDKTNGERIATLLREVQAGFGVTICMVTHNPGLAERCDTIFHLSDGKLEQDADHASRKAA
uniref:Lipoprotein-releasing system ATP-binding protein n=1 Tax=Candidatus Kentrum sp. DK TaxID=2126562 RepID=A0A450TMJ4_9GAMM|nr:MAG: lipoprotein-releasing system ATP-binding protein [Candidatus Kentron sp. DK]